MIALNYPAKCDAESRFITRLRAGPSDDVHDSWVLESSVEQSLWIGENGLVQIDAPADDLIDDVILVDPRANRIERIFRSGSDHNTLLVTERCDQLCVMCSQPPKKSHDDRFELLEQACLLAEPGSLIGISGGEPTLYKSELFSMLDSVLTVRSDLNFHILSNGQHIIAEDIAFLSQEYFKRVAWGIPLYAATPSLHDQIVAKSEAFDRLLDTFDHLLRSASRIELRTVLLQENLRHLPSLAEFISINLPFIEQWSIMGLENIGFAKSRWDSLYVDIRDAFGPLEFALDHARLRGVSAKVFNIPLCHLPAEFRDYAVASISDWKRRYSEACSNCCEQERCSGFFEWHPKELIDDVSPL